MKVIFVNTDGSNVINGINTWIVSIASRLQNKGINVEVLSYAWSPANECTTIKILRQRNIKVNIIDSRLMRAEQLRETLSFIREVRPDVIVTGNVVPALVAGLIAGIKTITVLHNDDREHQTFSDQFLNGLTSVHPSGLVLINDFFYEYLGKIRNDFIVKSIPFGYPINERICPFSRDILRLVYVGRIISKQKNVLKLARLIEAAAANVDSAVECAFIGSGPESAELKIICDLAKNSCLKYIGLLSPEQVINYLRSADGILLISDYEGLPRSILEAMSQGVIPITTPIRAIEKFIFDGENGLIIDPSIEGLTVAFTRLMSVATRRRLSDGAIDTVRKHFGESEEVDNWIGLLEELTKRPSSPLTALRRINAMLRWKTYERRAHNVNFSGRDFVKTTWKALSFNQSRISG